MKIWRNILVCAVLAVGIWGITVPAYSAYGLEETAGEIPELYNKNGTNPTVIERIGDIIGALLTLVGVVFFILVLYGGFMWMTARGHEEQAGKAIAIIFDAIIGIIIVLGSYAITDFVFKNIGIQPAPPEEVNQQTTNKEAPGGTAPAKPATKCEQYYGNVGLSCNTKNNCKGDAEEYKKVQTDTKQGNYKSGDKYITGLCPGSAEIVCCAKDKIGAIVPVAPTGNTGSKDVGSECDYPKDCKSDVCANANCSGANCNTNKKCQKSNYIKKVGDACFYGYNCESNSCVAYKCTIIPTKKLNDVCSSSAECVSPYSCVDKKCGKLPIGQDCSSDKNCTSNICAFVNLNKKECTTGKGSACLSNGIGACADGYECNGVGGNFGECIKKP